MRNKRRKKLKVYRGLYYRKSFWGIVKMEGRGWRIGFGCGFIEIATGMSGIHLPRRDALKGAAKDYFR